MEKKHQVFINFRGKDERMKLVPHLKHHLSDKNVNVFTDEDAFAEPLENLFKHIRNSRIVIVIFSINYLESRWCLDELVEIRKCLETEKIDFAVPIFYKVKASNVKKQSGAFGTRFRSLKKNHPNSRVKRWKRALKKVAANIGLTYTKKSSITELDFVKKVVEKVNIKLTQIASEGHNTQETSTKDLVSHTNKLLHLSSTLEALNIERSYREGFISGSTWTDLISSIQKNKSFMISLPQNSLHSLDIESNDSVEKATNFLALHMMTHQTQPALIFTNWDTLDQDIKISIIQLARKKCHMMSQMLKVYNMSVDDLKPLSRNYPPFVEEPTWYKMLEPKVSNDWIHRGFSYHDLRDQIYPLPYDMMSVQRPVVTQASIDNILRGMHTNDQKRKEDTNCISSLSCCFKLCLCLK